MASSTGFRRRERAHGDAQAGIASLQAQLASGEIDEQQFLQGIGALRADITKNAPDIRQETLDLFVSASRDVQSRMDIRSKEDAQLATIKDLLDHAKDVDQRDYDLRKDYFDWQKQTATEADAERKTISDEMLADARLTDDKVNQAVGKAVTDVEQAYASTDAENRRSLARMGVNPNSERALSVRGKDTLAKAATIAGAKNITRQNMRALSEDRLNNARLVRIGMQPLQLGVGNSQAGGPNYTLGAMGSMAATQGNIAAGARSQYNADRGYDLSKRQLDLTERQISAMDHNALTRDTLGAGAQIIGAYVGSK